MSCGNEEKPKDEKDMNSSQPNEDNDGLDINMETGASSGSRNSGQENVSLNLALFGSTAAVKTGSGSLLPEFSGQPGLTQLAPTEHRIAGRDVALINMIGLHEVTYSQESMDEYMGQILGEGGIHAFLYILPSRRLTDEDKMAVEWLQGVFGTSSLCFLIIIFSYNSEEDCDFIIDDLKGNTVLEQLVEKSGGRYCICNKGLSNQMEMRVLLKKIDLLSYEKKSHYTAESFSEQLNIRQTMSKKGNKELQHENRGDSDGAAEDVNQKGSTENEGKEVSQNSGGTHEIQTTSNEQLHIGGTAEDTNNGSVDTEGEKDCQNADETSEKTHEIQPTSNEQLKMSQSTSENQDVQQEHHSEPGGTAEDTNNGSVDTEKEKHSGENAEDPSTKKEEPRRTNNEQELEELFKRLNLTDKLSTSDVLKINVRLLQGPKGDGEITHTFLNRLFMTDYRARYIAVKEENNVVNPRESKRPDSQDRDVFATLFNKTEMEDERVKKQSQIHPMDVQMAVFHCADPFLRQDLLTKLSMCQYAVPLLVPHPSTSEIEFPLWALRQTWKSWRCTEASGKVTIHNEPIYGAETPMVSVFRLGPVSTSKSQLINSLINERHSTFFHRHCEGSSRTRLLMDGVVEIAWYCPSGKDTDHFPECVAICNLRGDAEACKRQREILSKMASVNVAFFPNLSKDDTSMAIVEELFNSPTPLICLLTENDSLLEEVYKGKFKMGLKDRNQSDIVRELKKAINDGLSLRKLESFRLENLAEQPGIKVDEDDEDCRMGKAVALKIKDLVKGNELSKVKETFLPCQGKLWHEWCQKKKDLFHLHGNLEKQMSLIKQEMRAIRSQQQKAGSSDLMKLFLGAMDSLSPVSRVYFLKWTRIIMDSCTSDDLVTLLHQYDAKWSEVLFLKKKHVKSGQLKKEQTELENISEQLNAATFDLEHILREMGQIYEAEISVTSGPGDYSKLPAMAAELMISGHPLELMDGDAAHVPMIWIGAVLDEVIKKIGDKRIFVLSVLGIQSTGKSTMLNAMFGLQFAVSAGRCTRGAFMQLVSVTGEMKTKSRLDYILVVDTEGLRALELAGKATIHHDNELATFVIGLGHMTLINIFGENPAEMQDIIQIAVQAFLRMKKVKLSPSCLFVHQNVGDITAGEKNMEGKRRLQDKLDEMTKLAAKEEDCDAKCFSDVIAFNVQKDVKYFAQLWEGSPPMAPPNPCYSENVQDLKQTILTKALESKGMQLSEFKTSISDLWNALLNENFVFSFKNTLEIAMYRKLETEYAKWTWSLRKAMLHIENKLHNRIENDNLNTIEERFLLAEMKPTYDEVEKTMAQYFDEHRDKEMLVQWRGRFEHKICDVHSDLVKETEKKLNNLIQQKKTRKKLDERKVHYQTTLFRKSKELALSLKHLEKSEKALKEEFDQMWENWLPELTSDLPRVKDCNIWEDVMNVLSENQEESYLNGRLKQADYKTITYRGDYSQYVTPIESPSHEPEPANNKKEHNAFVTFLGNAIERFFFKQKRSFNTDVLTAEDQESIKRLTQDIYGQTERIIKKYSAHTMGYSKTYIQEIADSVRNAVSNYEQKVMHGKFAFKKMFTVDLLLFVCDVASKQFAELHTKFQKANDGFLFLEDKKGQYYMVFKSFCQGAKSSAVLGDFICSKLKLSIRQAVYDQTAIDLANEMQSSFPVFSGNRNNLERHILLSLAEQENFEKFLKYIHNPKENFKNFITEQVKKYMMTVNSPILSKIQENLKYKIKCANVAAQTATEKVKANCGDANMWLKHFSDELQDELKFAETSYVDASEITDFDFVGEIVCKGLGKILQQLSETFSSLSLLETEQFRIKPDEILIQHFCKCCWVQCPFCKAICTNTFEDHHPSDHSVPFHRTNGLNGWHFRGTTNLCVDFCTTAVASQQHFYPSHHSKEAIPLKEYRKGGPKYANWSITPDHSELPYWKWFMCRFKADLEKHYNKTFQGHGEIPQEWSQYTKEQAKKSLDVYVLTDMGS